jgi:paraquat-inducible protein B
MTESEKNAKAGEELPKSRVRKDKWSFPVVWVVPLLAAIVAGYLVYHRVQDYGPTVRITFEDGSGLVTGQTPIKYRGVPIGQVEALELSKNLERVVVTARLRRSAISIARKGSEFWIVRPEVGVGNITGLGTVITGPEIAVQPGTGAVQSLFVGLERPPVAPTGKGLRVVLRSRHLGFLRPNSPVYYRGIEVGAVQDSQLGADATKVDINVFIQPRYAKLVREGSRFWDVSGVEVHFNLFHGLEINLESVKSLVSGGIAFATPAGSKPARDGMVFRLYDGPSKEWLEWVPEIAIPPEKQDIPRGG